MNAPRHFVRPPVDEVGPRFNRPVPREHFEALLRRRDRVDLYDWLDRGNQRRFNAGSAACIAVAVICIVYFGGQLLRGAF